MLLFHYLLHPVTMVIAMCAASFFVAWRFFWRLNKGPSFYFDAQDFAKYENGGGRKLPLSATNGTSEPLLQRYIDLTKLLITVAAASIAFANKTPSQGIFAAKLILAFSILCGVGFCALLLWAYDEYCQNVESYTRSIYSTVVALGSCSLLWFVVGYAVWAFSLE